MCGIAGFSGFQIPRAQIPEQLIDMGRAIEHRGPDAAGQYFDDQIGLCHQRLSIIDVSDAGSQPMTSATGRYVTVYNGEIYNFRSLREELEQTGVRFRGHSDTEVLLALYEAHGEACLEKLNGMFALAIWDKDERSLFLARDRLGKKPLYYYANEGKFAFASEIKALLCLPGINRSLRADAIRDFFTYQYIPDPKSIYTHVHKLMPGHSMTLKDGQIRHTQYWDVSFKNVTDKSEATVCNELYDLLDDSVRSRMISDVPLGAFLSGGVDSSAVVGLMAKASSTPVTTCAIGFDSEKFDEVVYARAVAERFGTDHHEFTVRENVEAHLIDIARYFDEPFADASFLPTYFVSQLARQKVTVALAGDGGDENFAGYSKYLNDKDENRLRSMVPNFVRRRLFCAMHRVLTGVDNHHARRARSLSGSLAVEPDTGFFISNSFFDQHLWQQLVRPEFERELDGYDISENTRNAYANADTDNHLSRILYTDIKTYLPGDILVKVDRMSMANSLETRAPILDYRVVEYAASIPPAMKLNGSESKSVLKKCMSSLLPDDILYRKKMGFSVPLSQWLRNEIKVPVETALFRPDNGLSQYFDIAVLRGLWDQHQRGRRDLHHELWSLFMFELWWQAYVKNA